MERYGEDLLVRRADVCSRLQRAVVDFCQHTYAGITVNDLEVDGIICISFSNSSEQHVVKIHEKLINARSSSSTDPTRERPITNSNENVLGNQPSPKCSSEITWRGTNEGPVVSAQIVNDTHSGGVQGMLSQASLHCDNIEHDETYIFPNINHERETQDGCIGSRKKVQKLRHEKQKKKFVESVEGDCVIVKVEPEEADSEISDGIYRESTKRADSIVPKSGSHDRHNSADKQSLVDSSEAAMYMVHSGFEFGNGSSSDDKTRDVNDFRYENSSVQFVNSQQVSTTPTWDFYPSSLNTDTHALTLSSVPHGSNEASTCDTNEINRRNTSLAKHFPKNEKWDASAFQNFNLPLASMDSVIPVHSSVELSSANVDAGSKTDVQLVSSLSPQYYKTDSGGNYNVRSQSKNLDDDEPKSRSPFCAKSLSDRGRNSALSHNRRISAIAAARSAARSMDTAIDHEDSCGYVCHICGESFSWRSTLNRHVSTHSQESQCSSFECGESFASECSLNNPDHQESSKICGNCGAIFKSRNALLNHVRYKHIKGKRKVCSVCDKKFKDAYALRRHMGTHSTGVSRWPQ